MPPSYAPTIGQLIDWYLRHKRDLPWRTTSDPYKIWLSEIILQQTRVDQGLPYYLRFIEHFPDVDKLADAEEQEVLRLWQGLGYYSRARNLHRCAMVVKTEYKGQFPSNYESLLKLPGIGPYTAAAIASIAFGERVPAIDGNVFRVVSRFLGISDNIAKAKNRKVFEKLSAELIVDQNPSHYNQAMMELGATVCLPRKPQCGDCPLNSNCYARLHESQEAFPVNQKRIKVKHRYFNYFVFLSRDQVAIKERRAKDIWQGLHDFYTIETYRLLTPDEAMGELPEEVGKTATLIRASPDYKHILTHQRILARFFTIDVNDLNFVSKFEDNQTIKTVRLTALDAVPKPRLIDRFLADEKII